MSEHIGFRCPDDVADVIRQQIEESGKGRSDVIIEMLRSTLPSVRVEAEVWENFKAKAVSDGQTANSVLNQLIQQYLLDSVVPQTLSRLEAKLKEMEERLALLENPETKFAFLGKKRSVPCGSGTKKT